MSIPNNNNPKSMKGLLKGLRYISQMFDNDEKEPEMEIGNPTDVKHVAHIGWDGNKEAPPSWMTEFKGQPQEVEQKSRATSSTGGNIDSSSKRQARKTSRNGNREQEGGGAKPASTRRSNSKEGVVDTQEGAKKGRRKKSKDSDGTKSKSKASAEVSVVGEPSTSQPDIGTTVGLSPVEEEL